MRWLNNRGTSLLLLALVAAVVPLRSQNVHHFPRPPRAPRNPPIPAKILTASSVHFYNETGDAAVGREALRELSGWGRFRLVDQRDAQLLVVLSTQEFSDNEFSQLEDFGGATMHPPRKPLSAFLTVIDGSTGDRLWIDSRPWGGLLTGRNSAGRRLIVRFRKHVDARPSTS